ncbi:hypothetical protein ACFL20_11440 [Spirochaetota bacterium]
MSKNAQMIAEISFNLFYLISVVIMVVIMFRKRANVAENEWKSAFWLLMAYFFLAIGDIPHLGTRVIAFAMGGLETSITIGNSKWNISGLGAFITSLTFAIYYICMLLLWKNRYNKKLGIIGWAVIIIAVIRTIYMLIPGNGWDVMIPPRSFWLIRNNMLMLMQLLVAFLILKDSIAAKEKVLKQIGIFILVSFTFYSIVVFLYHSYPSIGMLMIFKTIAYLIIAFLGMSMLFRIGMVEKNNNRINVNDTRIKIPICLSTFSFAAIESFKIRKATRSCISMSMLFRISQNERGGIITSQPFPGINI